MNANLELTLMEITIVETLLYRASDRLQSHIAAAHQEGIHGHAGVYEEMLRENEALLEKFRAASKEAR